MNRFYDLLQGTSNLISRINEAFYWHIDIDTKIPWAAILFMYGLYWLVNKFLKDQKMDSKELLILLSGYMFFLLAIAGSYSDFEKIKNTPNSEHTFFMVCGVCVGIVILVAVLGASEFKENDYKKKLILGALYAPVILLILTNGRILYERFESLKALIPRSNSYYIDLPSEYDEVRIGGVISEEQLERVSGLIVEHEKVADAAIVGKKDPRDGIIKPYAFVQLHEGEPSSDFLKRDIGKFLVKRVEEYNASLNTGNVGSDRLQEWAAKGLIDPSRVPGKKSAISPFLVPEWFTFRKRIPYKDDKVYYKLLQKEAKNWADLFAGTGMTQ